MFANRPLRLGRRALTGLSLALLTLVALLTPAQAASADYPCRVALPMALGAQRPTPTPAPTPSPTPAGPCAQAQVMAALIAGHPGQRRATMVLDPILQQVAQARAEDMAARHYFDHTNPEGYGPNYLVRQAGYPLPSYYLTAPTANNIESLAADSPDAELILQAWLASPGHRVHVLGEQTFFAAQIEYGIGYATSTGGEYSEYWVFISACRAR